MRELTGEIIKYDTVVNVFKSKGIRSAPLLYPVNEIEGVMKKAGYLKENEFFASFDTSKEAFPVIFDDEIKPKNSWRLKLAKFILPK